MKILIGTPCYDNKLDSRMVSSVLDFIKECEKRNVGVNWDRPSSPMLAYNRNLICETAIEEEYNWILFWDADISVEKPATIFDMLDTAFHKEASIIAAPVRLKHPTEKKWNFAMRKNGVYVYFKELPEDSTTIDVIGTGLMLIHTAIFHRVSPPWFSFTEIYDQGRIGFFPEDWGFCEKVLSELESAREILMDPRVKTIHWGSAPFSDDFPKN